MFFFSFCLVAHYTFSYRFSLPWVLIQTRTFFFASLWCSTTPSYSPAPCHVAEFQKRLNIPAMNTNQSLAIRVQLTSTFWHTSTPSTLPEFTLALSMLCAPVFMFTSSCSALLGRPIWFIDLFIATCRIKYTFLNLWQYFSRENRQNTTNSAIFVWYENDPDS